jgi:formiminoglutamase
MENLFVYQANEWKNLIKIRAGETKLGEKIALDWQDSEVKYVLLGIEEDIGVQVNGGIGGTKTAWKSFISSFLNIQSIDALTGSSIGIYGFLNFDNYAQNINSVTVEMIDGFVEKAIAEIISQHKTPIVIGGGHNNAYPIIKAVSKIKKEAIGVINLDAHSDFRIKEGRHSGNAFRYAFDEKWMAKYAVVGLHENYNSQAIINEMAANEAIKYTFWEAIFLREQVTFKKAIQESLDFLDNKTIGIELDLDAICNTLSSAMTPSGVSSTEARRYVFQTAKQPNVAYLHLCEGATALANGQENPSTGKLIAYLVADFIKSNSSIIK